MHEGIVWWVALGVAGNVVSWFDGGRERALRGQPGPVMAIWAMFTLLGPIPLAGAVWRLTRRGGS